jgi:hypothetical protein
MRTDQSIFKAKLKPPLEDITEQIDDFEKLLDVCKQYLNEYAVTSDTLILDLKCLL